MNEESAIVAARAGDVSAFNQLVLAYQSAAYNVAYRILGNGDAAADATQEAFVSAFQAMRSFRGGAFRAWILRIVTNACYDQMRRELRHPSAPFDDPASETEPRLEIASGEDGPERHALRFELGELIQSGIRSLPPDQRVAVVLRDIQGLSYEEIAETTGVSLGTVKSRLSRGRATLRDRLMERQELLPAGLRLC